MFGSFLLLSLQDHVTVLCHPQNLTSWVFQTYHHELMSLHIFDEFQFPAMLILREVHIAPSGEPEKLLHLDLCDQLLLHILSMILELGWSLFLVFFQWTGKCTHISVSLFYLTLSH